MIFPNYFSPKARSTGFPNRQRRHHWQGPKFACEFSGVGAGWDAEEKKQTCLKRSGNV